MVSDYVEDATTRVAPGRRSLRLLSVDLVVVDGPGRGQRASVRAGAARIGTAEGVDLRLADPTVSRLHCEIRVRPDAITLRDHGSTNGTHVGGVRVRDADVPAGTGTGKDVVARSLHAASRRAAGPFVPIDCGAIPENLIESELFGHVRGAFSGAVSDRKGVFEEAEGGTLFLDEIGEMPLALQLKLLRAIETRTFRRVGAASARPADVRLVAATNRDLARCVNEGTFREDLYYRLAVVEVTLPPLRDRPEDIPSLAQCFYDRLAPGAGPLPQDFARMLASRSWPGNVRELRNFIERSVSLGFVSRSLPAPAPTSSRPAPRADVESLVPLHLPLKDARQAWTSSFEEIYVRAMLRKTGGNEAWCMLACP